jgi:hypothetical protein
MKHGSSGPREFMRGLNSVMGFAVLDETAVVTGNVAKGSGMAGFAVAGSSSMVVTKNLAIANSGDGFQTAVYPPQTGATFPTFSKNAAIGNGRAGLESTAGGAQAATLTIEKSTFMGNGGQAGYSAPNCGLVVSNYDVPTFTVNADGNYWGAATGPGANPADAAGGACNAGTVTLNLAQWVSKEIKVAPPVVK